jgi:hypothetical protein
LAAAGRDKRPAPKLTPIAPMRYVLSACRPSSYVENVKAGRIVILHSEFQ